MFFSFSAGGVQCGGAGSVRIILDEHLTMHRSCYKEGNIEGGIGSFKVGFDRFLPLIYLISL
jgi:hypothetical protein